MVELIKSYLPLRIQISDDQNNEYSVFMYIKEQSVGKKGERSNVLFVCNAIALRPRDSTLSISSSDLQSFDEYALKYIFNKYGNVQKVICAAAPGQGELGGASLESVNSHSYVPKRLPFAHVTFSSYKDVKKVLSRASQGSLQLSRMECNEIVDHWNELRENDDSSNSDDESVENEFTKPESLIGIAAVVARYKSRISDRAELADQCDEIMAKFEASEEEERQAMLNSGEPDNDGFITITRDSNLVGRKRSSQELNDNMKGDEVEAHGLKRKGSKRSRKRKEGRGTSELKDFYRFQTRESKRKEVVDLRQRFEEDLQSIKRMKEQKQFNPLA